MASEKYLNKYGLKDFYNHDEWSNEMEQNLYVACDTAIAIAFDGCHKIYIALDAQERQKLKDLGYEIMIDRDDLDMDQIYDILQDWYDNSCPLRLIDAVCTVDEGENPNDGYVCCIPQFCEGAFDIYD